MVRCKRKGRPGLGYLLCWNGRLRWWLRIYLSGWLGTSDACGRSPWHAGSGRPPESAQKRGAFHREPLPHFTPDLTRRTRPGPTKATRGGHPPPHGNATDERRDLPTYPPGEGPELERNPGTQPSQPPRPRRRLVTQAGNRTNPPIPDQPDLRTETMPTAWRSTSGGPDQWRPGRSTQHPNPPIRRPSRRCLATEAAGTPRADPDQPLAREPALPQAYQVRHAGDMRS